MRAVSLLVATCLVMACGGDDVTGTATVDPLVGTYALKTVGDKTVPAIVVQSGTVTKTITQGSLDLTTSGSFEIRWTTRSVSNGVQTELREDILTGSWARFGTSAIALTEVITNGNSGVFPTFSGALDGATITTTGTLFSQVGGAFAFTK